METTRLSAWLISIALSAYCASTAAANTTSPNSQYLLPVSGASAKPFPRLLPLQLTLPATAQVATPLTGVSVTLQNPGETAPNSRLRLLIHAAAHSHGGAHTTLSPGNVTVEVFENGVWVPVNLAMADEGVMGAIGPAVGRAHSERYQRGGFAIPAGLNKTWQLRLTFNVPGTYTLVTSVSPDNGSRHLAQPAHSTITVQ